MRGQKSVKSRKTLKNLKTSFIHTQKYAHKYRFAYFDRVKTLRVGKKAKLLGDGEDSLSGSGLIRLIRDGDGEDDLSGAGRGGV